MSMDSGLKTRLQLWVLRIAKHMSASPMPTVLSVNGATDSGCSNEPVCRLESQFFPWHSLTFDIPKCGKLHFQVRLNGREEIKIDEVILESELPHGAAMLQMLNQLIPAIETGSWPFARLRADLCIELRTRDGTLK